MALVPPYIETLRPYEPGRSVEEVQREYGLRHVAKLASNENPLGPSPLAIKAIAGCLDTLHLYPNGGLDDQSGNEEEGYRNLLDDEDESDSMENEFNFEEESLRQPPGFHQVKHMAPGEVADDSEDD